MDNILDMLLDNIYEFMLFFRVGCNDTKANREALLKTSKLCYWYCRYVKNSAEVRKGITESSHAYWYCRYVTPDEEIAGRITEPKWVNAYLNWRIRIEGEGHDR